MNRVHTHHAPSEQNVLQKRRIARPDNMPVYVAAALGYVLFFPPQLNISIMGSVLPPYRFFLIPAFLFVIARAVRGNFKFVLPDYLIIIATAWIWLALYMTSDFDDFFTGSVAQTIDIALAYFLARVTIQSLRDLRMFLLLMLPGLVLMAAVLVLESITHTHILQPIIGGLIGKGGYYPIDERMGLMRGRGPFAHAILAGIFFASFLPLYVQSGIRGWPRIAGILASVAAFFTVSSAALLALTSATALLVYNWITHRVENISWRLFFIVLVMFIIVAEFGTKSGSFNLIMRFGSLNSSSAFNRVLIWRYGSQNVAKNPWFGLGFADWERPFWMGKSVDHYWLLQAMKFGILPSVCIAIATTLAVLATIRAARNYSGIDRETLRGVAIALAVFGLGIVSVSIWLSVHVWFYMLVGMTVSLGYGLSQKRLVVRQPVPRAYNTPPQRRPDYEPQDQVGGSFPA